MKYFTAEFILRDNIDAFVELVKNGVIDINIRNLEEKTLLFYNYTQFKVLLSLGINIDAQDAYGDTWLHNRTSPGVQAFFNWLPSNPTVKFNPNLKNKAGKCLLTSWVDKKCIQDLLNMDTKHFTEELESIELLANTSFEFTVEDIKNIVTSYANRPEKNEHISRALLNPRILNSEELVEEILKYEPTFSSSKTTEDIEDLIVEFSNIKVAIKFQEYCRKYHRTSSYIIFSNCIVKRSAFEATPLIKQLRSDAAIFDRLKTLEI